MPIESDIDGNNSILGAYFKDLTFCLNSFKVITRTINAHMTKQGRIPPRTKGFSNPFITCPASESLIRRDEKSLWKREILDNPRLMLLSKRRRDLAARLDFLFRLVPRADMDFGDALRKGFVGERDLVPLYEAFTAFLREEKYGERLLLYFPIELIPGQDWQLDTEELREATKDFSRTYLEKWHILLTKEDMRANFVDGNIPEIEMWKDPPPKVIKAAHLIPALLHKGMVSTEDIDRLLEETENELLRISIREVLLARFDQDSTPSMRKKRNELQDATWLPRRITKALEAIETTKGDIARNPSSKPVPRIKWEMSNEETNLVEETASDVALALILGTLLPGELAHYLANEDDRNTLRIGIIAFQKAIEANARSDETRAKSAYEAFEPLAEKLWKTDNGIIREALESALSRLAVLGIAPQNKLEELGVEIPQFDEDICPRRLDTFTQFIKVAQAIEADTELSQYLLPVVLPYGSKVKGYGRFTSDQDFAVFVRPNMSFGFRALMQALLAKTLGTFGITGKAFEFWLEESDGILKIRDFPELDRSLGASYFVHVLFGGVWVGNRDSMRDIFEKVLAGYLDSKGSALFGVKAQEVWLREIERDTLQYRLMHKGYMHFYPEQRTTCVPENIVDYKGSFWDSGYRRLATKLFLKKVFLPQL